MNNWLLLTSSGFFYFLMIYDSSKISSSDQNIKLYYILLFAWFYYLPLGFCELLKLKGIQKIHQTAWDGIILNKIFITLRRRNLEEHFRQLIDTRYPLMPFWVILRRRTIWRLWNGNVENFENFVYNQSVRRRCRHSLRMGEQTSPSLPESNYFIWLFYPTLIKHTYFCPHEHFEMVSRP